LVPRFPTSSEFCGVFIKPLNPSCGLHNEDDEKEAEKKKEKCVDEQNHGRLAWEQTGFAKVFYLSASNSTHVAPHFTVTTRCPNTRTSFI
jgi:hypothetical protein